MAIGMVGVTWSGRVAMIQGRDSLSQSHTHTACLPASPSHEAMHSVFRRLENLEKAS